MPITFVDRQLNDNSRVVDPLLTEAATYSSRSTVKSGSSLRHFFVSEYITTNVLQNNKHDCGHQNYESILVEVSINLMG